MNACKTNFLNKIKRSLLFKEFNKSIDSTCIEFLLFGLNYPHHCSALQPRRYFISEYRQLVY